MLADVPLKRYRERFSDDPHPYISESFIELVAKKTDRVLRIIDLNEICSVGLIAGLNNNIIYSPFSAPFGGFHYVTEEVNYDHIYDFVILIQEFIVENNYKSIEITLPPDVYQKSTNAKFINAFIRLGFTISAADIANWVDLTRFDGTWIRSQVTSNCKRAMRNELVFELAQDEKSKREAFEINYLNRIEQNRKIHMTFDDLMMVNQIIPVDFFLVKDSEENNIAAGIFYRGHEKIVQGVFIGDILKKRSLFGVDFLYLNVYNYYKKLGYDFIDLGTSSLDGIPNNGLIRFKEYHLCVSSIKYTFTWSPEN